MIIIGFTQEKRIISALVLGIYFEDKLTYIGSVGTGFSYKFLEGLYKKIKILETKKPPVSYEGRKEIIWLKPQLVCEVTFLALTKDYKLRAPVFLHMRWDKNPKEYILEEQLIEVSKRKTFKMI